MRIANLDGRLALIAGDRALDVATASDGRFGPDPRDAYEHWDAFAAWGARQDVAAGAPFDRADLGPVVPEPRQIFAIGLNYVSHADESGFAVPENPIVFTKFVSSLAGAEQDVPLGGDRVDWEAELVAVIGRGGRDIPPEDGWAHVAALAVGQDLSDRTAQFLGSPPQFSLGKSAAGFGPVGPWAVSVDELAAEHDLDALDIRCRLVAPDGEERLLQAGSTRDLIVSVPRLVSWLSRTVELLPGDLVFTGTPAGVGVGRDPQEFLEVGHTLRTEIEGIGEIVQRFVPGTPRR